jgi:hypothetical protein
MRKLLLVLVALAALSARASALTPGELTQQERSIYETIKSDPKSVESFLATRDYARKAAAIVAAPADKGLARQLKRPKNFNAKWLLAGESDKVNAAVELSLNALAEAMWA